jgi:bifunctional DNA-binding transcriptional regulator/antitoxin component of YhaV-PrlF toxin-antitoxin module
MAKGIVRKIDELGRITLPIEIRRRFELKDSDRVGLQLDGQVIRISKHITGMSRPLDSLGRIALPIEYRRALGLGERHMLDMYIDDGDICIGKDGCEWCGSGEDLMDINGHCLCRKCAYSVVDTVMEV